MNRTIVLAAAGLLSAVVGGGPAWGHAGFENGAVPPASHADLTLHVPVEQPDAVNSRIEVKLPGGFEAHSCTAEAGWSCTVGGPDEPETITFTRLDDGHESDHGHHQKEAARRSARAASFGPMDEDPGPGTTPEPGHEPGGDEGSEGQVFRFAVRSPGAAGDYPIAVQQRYSNGDEIGWDGPAGSETPAPVLSVR